MANESINNAKKEKFMGLLHELFQLNQPELDFGLYRIMHAKSDQIKAFIQNDLASEIDDAFADSGDDKIADLKANYEQARAQAVEFGIDDPDSNPKVKEAREAYDAARDNGDDPSDIYDHLYRFFSRYYDKGDFLSRRYHVGENESRAAPYAVPYDGREVYLHWANKDQYYIKSSEYLSNFSFDLLEATEKERKRQGLSGQGALGLDDSASDSCKVTFQLVDAAEGAHNNVKDNQARFFIIHADKPIDVRPLISADGEADGHGLIINFEYRSDPEKSGQEGVWQKKRLQEAETAILEALKADESLKPFHDALTFLAPTEKDKARTLLAKYLTSYTARNTMDYFIHKDLGGFLRRELDFYIKNEIMRLDDLSGDDITGVTHSLKKITALRSIARQIIDFLAQLENFQKKLWLKKKFVTEVNYCITLDRVPESLYGQIVANERQWQEWRSLGFLEKTEPSIEILKDQPFMMVDTGLFEEDFKELLLAEIEELDEKCDGVLIHSENFQALNLMRHKYAGKAKCIYIDPPYNTGNDGFAYKDSYQHSSWLSMINDRAESGKSFAREDAAIFASIDEVEQPNLRNVMDLTWGSENFVADMVWAAGRKNDSRLISVSHEYLIVYARNRQYLSDSKIEWRQRKKGLDEIYSQYKKLKRDYGADYSAMTKALKQWFKELPDSHPAKAHKHYSCVDKRGVYFPADISWPGGGGPKYQVLHPVTGKPVKVPSRGWMTSDEEKMKKWIEEDRVHFGETEESVPCIKSYLNDREYQAPYSVFYQDGRAATKRLRHVIGNDDFGYPKDELVISEALGMMLEAEDLTLDYFAGSGTTAHSVINLNRADGGKRKYVLVEMGGYFDSVLRPRIEKVIYSESWKDGQPTKPKSGISHCFKYLRLESYEDTVNNLMSSEENSLESLLSSDGNSELKKGYYLNYFLDVETRDSPSLLNMQKFEDPSAYSLKVKKPGFDAQVPVNVDLVETFNWLIGLEVALLDKPRIYDADFEREHDPELPEDQHTRLKVTRFKEDDEGSHWFRVVEGYVRRTPGNDADKEKVMVIWRKLTGDPEKDAAALEALLSKYRVNQSDSEYDKIYINGPHGLSLSGQAKAKVLSLEETFMARMWEDTDGAMY